ncbi:hypothetical protein J7T55_011347 [Diaporthe amygdali]|uniref:uncharacterized protein n=1 Tax=Phomopsis amygdali TaxID=1214568 RepID=UPI0022FE4F03|nr:uncharacterized protein J7T55_011347 [Diaporthe amygdali]KAJ0108853.1 hypothetical protein J7T55_011347 [Diaporthe amygdali]
MSQRIRSRLVNVRENAGHFIYPEPADEMELPEMRCFDPNDCSCLNFEGSEYFKWNFAVPDKGDRTGRSQLDQPLGDLDGAGSGHLVAQHLLCLFNPHVSHSSDACKLKPQWHTSRPDNPEVKHGPEACLLEQATTLIRMGTKLLTQQSHDLTADAEGFEVFWCHQRKCRNYHRRVPGLSRILREFDHYNFALYLYSGATRFAAMSCPDSSQPPRMFVPRLWTPPDDPDKPLFPYITGFTTQIHRHVAPPPFGAPDYGPGPRPQLSLQYMTSVPQSELVVDNPPLKTAPSQAETTQLIINTPISVGSADGAQVVTCSITPDAETAGQSFQAVAKIYDPLYYRFSEWIAHEPRDVVIEADKDYSREAAAYEYLQKTGQTGSFAPAYYGSWTFALPITSRGKTQTRPIRLVLIEYLGGTNIRGSLFQNGPERAGKDAFYYAEEYRLEVLALAMDGYVRQLHSGIDQLDFAGRNVMLAPWSLSAEPGQDSPAVAGLSLPRIVLVDYNAAIVYTQSKRGRLPHMDWPRPCNPMWYFWDEPMDDFGGWVPHEWHHNPKFMQEWLQKRFGTEEKRKLYASVEEELIIRDYDLPEWQ